MCVCMCVCVCVCVCVCMCGYVHDDKLVFSSHLSVSRPHLWLLHSHFSLLIVCVCTCGCVLFTKHQSEFLFMSLELCLVLKFYFETVSAVFFSYY